MFAFLTVLLLAGLSWISGRLYQQGDRLIEERLQDELALGADQITSSIRQSIVSWRDRLSSLGQASSTDLDSLLPIQAGELSTAAVIMVISDEQAYWTPDEAILYPPVSHFSDPTLDRVFIEGERMEFRAGDITGAIESYAFRTESLNLSIQAGAYMRLARCEYKRGNLTRALDHYATLTSYGERLVTDQPARLIGLFQQGVILAELQRWDSFTHTMQEIYRYLRSGRPPISYMAYLSYHDELARIANQSSGSGQSLDRAPSADDIEASEFTLDHTQAAYDLWRTWRENRSIRSRSWTGFTLLNQHEQYEHMLVAQEWASPSRLSFILGSVDAFWTWWMPELQTIKRQRDLIVTLLDVETDEPISGNILPDNRWTRKLGPVETGLPWTINLALANPLARVVTMRDQQLFLLAGLILATLLILFTGYSLTRAVLREMQAAKMQSDFVSTVSHEFRTPLTAMRQVAEMITHDRIVDRDQQDRYLHIIEQEGNRLHRLVESVLDFRRMEAGTHQYSMRPVDIAAMTSEVTEMFQEEICPQGYHVHVDLHVEDVPVYGDRDALGRVVWNLLDNAVKYSPVAEPISVTLEQSAETIALHISDRGLGIPEKEQKAIFDKFVRGESAKQTTASGTGLGLAIAQQIAEAHQGHITVRSTPGTGSTFTVHLPIWRPS